MNFENFVTIDFILSFAGMVVVVILLTQFTKSMFDKLFTNKTKHIVYFFAFLLCVLAALYSGDFTTTKMIIQTIVTWFVNSIIVWLSAMKAFEEVNEFLDGVD